MLKTWLFLFTKSEIFVLLKEGGEGGGKRKGEIGGVCIFCGKEQYVAIGSFFFLKIYFITACVQV